MKNAVAQHSRETPGQIFRALLALWLPVLLSLAWAAPAAAQPYTYTVAASRGLVLQTGGTQSFVWAQCSEGLSGGACATGIAAQYTFDGALTQATTQNTASYLGYTDWRSPSRTELQSLVQGGSSNLSIDPTLIPSIDSTVFPGTLSERYWAPGAAYPYGLWCVSFCDGYTLADLSTNPNYVRLVRSGQFFNPDSSTTVSAVALSNTTGPGTTLTAAPSRGAVLTGWSGSGCAGQSVTCPVIVTSTASVSAHFGLTNVLGATLNIDIDGDGKYLAHTDGLLLHRYLRGLKRNALTTAAVATSVANGGTATRATNAAIEAYLETCTPSSTCYLLGFRGTALVAGITPPSGITAAQFAVMVEANMAAITPVVP